jgi:hypothetical protein
MKQKKIKVIYQFIEFLYSKTEDLKLNEDIISELDSLNSERQKVSSKRTFRDKMKYDEVQVKIEERFVMLQKNIIKPIKDKAIELHLCDINKTETLWNWNITEIRDFQKNSCLEDQKEALIYKNKYFEFRSRIKEMLYLDLFFTKVDEILMEHLNFFMIDEHEKFQSLVHLTTDVDSLDDVIKLIKGDSFQEFTIPNPIFRSMRKNESNNVQKSNAQIDFSKEDKPKDPIYPVTKLDLSFDPRIFKDDYSCRLFCYLIDHYHSGKDKELSNIYQWMENKKLIHQNKRKEFKELVTNKQHNITCNKYSRVHSSNEYDSGKLDPTFNELQKQFEKHIKR